MAVIAITRDDALLAVPAARHSARPYQHHTMSQTPTGRVRQLCAVRAAERDDPMAEAVVDREDQRLSIDDDGDPTEVMPLEELQTLVLRDFFEIGRGSGSHDHRKCLGLSPSAYFARIRRYESDLNRATSWRQDSHACRA
jgi:hypothetical protein